MSLNFSEVSVLSLKGVGPRRASLLEKIGIKTLKDALYYLPFRYEDRRYICKINELTVDQHETVSGTVKNERTVKTPFKRATIFELTINDGTGVLKAKWFQQPYMKKQFNVGQEVMLSGMVKATSHFYEMLNPDFETIEDNTAGELYPVLPVYRTTPGLSQKIFRKLMQTIIDHSLSLMEDPVPGMILKRNKLSTLSESIRNIHFPGSDVDIETINRGESPYNERLTFDQFFFLRMGVELLKKQRTTQKGISFNIKSSYVNVLLQALPFTLTKAQDRVLKEIQKDMTSPFPMNRLIQGDVGSGKTIVALISMLIATDNGYQAALMAPTEILAEQHFYSIKKLLFTVTKKSSFNFKIALLTGKREEIYSGEGDEGGDCNLREMISQGEINLIIGTHSLIQERARFKKLGFVVIDEQHRFGVMQRVALRGKGAYPEVIVMTATPIPRTLALTFYGDLSYSVIDELPPNRTPIKTALYFENRKEPIYSEIKKEVKEGGQVYVVYPAVEESEHIFLHSATNGKTALEKVFPDFNIGLMHGRMPPREREEVMECFRKGELDILVSTTVIEVGVDVPNATLMLIVHAERFGLSQLHQLRGRVGRGLKESKCLLLAYNPLTEEAKRRLKMMLQSTDGFRIAEEDMDIRGPGEFLGTMQSGMPDLKISNLKKDAKLLETAKKEAEQLVSTDWELKKYPILKKELNSFWRGKIELLHSC